MKRKITYKSLIIYAIVAALLTTGAVAFMRRSNGELPNVQTATVSRGTVLSSVSGSGVLEPITTVEVKSNVGGQVVEMPVEEGDVVTAGQVIARIDPSDSISSLDQAKADFAGAVAKVDSAKHSVNMQALQTDASIATAEQALESAKLKLSQVEQEAKVQPRMTTEAIRQAQSALDSAQANLSQTKSALIPQKMASAKASHDEAKASFEKAEKSLNRQEALLEKGFISKSQLEETQAAYSVAKAQLDTSTSKLDTVKDECDQDLNSAQSKVDQAKSALESAKLNSVQDTLKRKELAVSKSAVKQAVSALASAKASSYQNQIKADDTLQARAQLHKVQAALINAQTQLGYTTVVAPRAGVIVKKYAEQGSIVTAGRQAMAGSGSGVTIVEIADISRMRVVVDVDETDVSQISIGMPVSVTIDAIPDGAVPAKVIKIAPQAEVTSNVTTVSVTVELSKVDARLKPQMNATCDFVVGQKENVLYVPIEAVVDTDSGPMVTVFDGEQQVARKVEVGLMGNDNYEVTSGLKDGETIVIPEETPTKSSGGPGGPGGPPPF